MSDPSMIRRPSALIFIADGTEEMEFTITYDTLIRAGVSAVSAYVPEASDPHSSDQGASPSNVGPSMSPPFAKGSRGINIMPDTYFTASSCNPDRFDLLVIPGGAKGADTITKNKDVQKLVQTFIQQDKYVGMICAGSLGALTSDLPRQKVTSHPSVKQDLEKDFDYSEEPVVVSGKLVTSRGPGTAFPFALTLVELLCGADKREEVRKPMVFPSGTPFV